MKKIAILMLHLKYGGIEKQTIAMANLLANDYKIELVSLYQFDEVAYKLNPKIKVRYLMNKGSNREAFMDCLHHKKIIGVLKEGFKSIGILLSKKAYLIHYIKHSNADILFATRIEFAKLLSQYAKEGVIKITQEHNYIDTKRYAHEVQNSMYNLDYVVVMTDLAKTKYQTWLAGYKTEVVVIPNLLDYIPATSSNLKNNRLIAIGRLAPVKNFDVLIKVMALVHQYDKQITLEIVGDGALMNALKEQVMNLKLSKVVTFKGSLSSDEVTNELLHSDLYVMTSQRECFPMVVLESYACGVPVISFKIEAGPIAMIKDHQTGYLISNHDTEAMAKQIITYMHDKTIKKKLGYEAKLEANRYSSINIKPLWLQLLGGL